MVVVVVVVLPPLLPLPCKLVNVMDVVCPESTSSGVTTYRKHKSPQRFAPCWLDYVTPRSSVTTLPQSLLPSRTHSWLASINPPYLHFHLYVPFFSNINAYIRDNNGPSHSPGAAHGVNVASIRFNHFVWYAALWRHRICEFFSVYACIFYC